MEELEKLMRSNRRRERALYFMLGMVAGIAISMGIITLNYFYV